VNASSRAKQPPIPHPFPLLPKENGKLKPPLSARERGGGEGRTQMNADKSQEVMDRIYRIHNTDRRFPRNGFNEIIINQIVILTEPVLFHIWEQSDMIAKWE